MLIRHEKEFMDTAWKTGVWASDITGVAATPTGSQVIHWSDYTGSDPIGDIKRKSTAMQLSTAGYRPNVLAVGREVWETLSDHPDVLDRLKYGQTSGAPAMATRDAFARLVEVDEVISLEAVLNEAIETTDAAHPETNAFMAGKDALLLHRPANAGRNIPSAGYTFAWTGYAGASAASRGGSHQALPDGEHCLRSDRGRDRHRLQGDRRRPRHLLLGGHCLMPATSQPFDKARPVVVRRPFNENGRRRAPGETFDWQRMAIGLRRVAQLFEAGYLRHDDLPEPEPEPEPEVEPEVEPEIDGDDAIKSKSRGRRNQ